MPASVTVGATGLVLLVSGTSTPSAPTTNFSTIAEARMRSPSSPVSSMM
jgi:hypothetical protein